MQQNKATPVVCLLCSEPCQLAKPARALRSYIKCMLVILQAKHTAVAAHHSETDAHVMHLHANFTAALQSSAAVCTEHQHLIRMRCSYLSVRSNALLVDGHRDYDVGVGHSLTQGLALGCVKEANHCTSECTQPQSSTNLADASFMHSLTHSFIHLFTHYIFVVFQGPARTDRLCETQLMISL